MDCGGRKEKQRKWKEGERKKVRFEGEKENGRRRSDWMVVIRVGRCESATVGVWVRDTRENTQTKRKVQTKGGLLHLAHAKTANSPQWQRWGLGIKEWKMGSRKGGWGVGFEEWGSWRLGLATRRVPRMGRFRP